MSEPAKLPSGAPETPPEPENEVKAGFLEHLDELRKRLVKAMIGIGLGALVVGVFSEDIFHYVMKPVLSSLPEGQQRLHFTSYLEPFFVYLKVALYGGLFLAAPWVLFQLWQFVAPGLYRKERKLVVPFLFFGTLLFYLGAAFCYYLVMPVAFPALAGIAGADMSPILTMKEQLGLVLAMILGFGIVFELPVIIAFLSLIGLVTPQFLAKYRRHAIVVNTALAAIITPTGDPFSLALMAVPMIVFYEVGILVARIIGKKPAPEAADKAAAPAEKPAST
ncbi:MAG TPA: twin-arginine translocase subunit TatC [Anaeromyxobacteraceae bacterium]|nr:twin-arginine translocase subunit TatC [Anaeromyxobacteraceae bacterium]